MTTNLAAWAYDDKVTHPYKSLTGSNANSEDLWNAPYWCCPNGEVRGTDITSYNSNAQLGLLYTWDAVTAYTRYLPQ